MKRENYLLEIDEWLLEESESVKKQVKSKAFIGDRAYRHFDARVALGQLQTGEANVLLDELRFPAILTKHAFYPFIRKDKKVRRFTKETTITGEKLIVIKQKLRPIMYAAHRDAIVFGFYGWMLKKLYDKEAEALGIADSVIAYRKIPRNDGSKRNKSNIDFANDIYTALSKESNVAVLCLDITDFFGSMEHVRIRLSWCNLLQKNKLPPGHQTVFRNITRYRYLFLNDVLVALKFGKVHKGVFRYSKKIRRIDRTGPLTKNSKVYNRVIKPSKLIKVNGSPKGIPQGSPISDIIANMYLMNFDSNVTDLLKQFNIGLYRRYSDDILIICPPDKAKEVYTTISKFLYDEGLQINQKKTELFFIDRKNHELADRTKLIVKGYGKNKTTIQYLGFEFDLKDIHIRSGTIANYYRKLKNKIRVKKERDDDKESKNGKRKRHKKDRYSYIKRSASRIGGDRLNQQFSNVRKRTARLRRETKDKK